MHNAFAKKMRQLRTERDVTLRELAEATGKSIAYLSDVEHGRRRPPVPSVVEALEKRLEVPAGELAEAARIARQAPRSFTHLMSRVPAVADLAKTLMRADNEMSDEELQKLVRRMQEQVDGVIE